MAEEGISFEEASQPSLETGISFAEAATPSLKRDVARKTGAFMTGVGKMVPFGQDIPAAISAARSYLPEAAPGAHPAGVPREGGFGSRMEAAKRAQIGAAEELGAESPWTQRAGMATGFAGTLSPLGKVAQAERGLAGALQYYTPQAVTKLLPRAAPAVAKGTAAGVIGSELGAAYGAGEGVTPEERLANMKRGALIGGGLSAAVPFLGGLVSKGYQALREEFPGLISGAEKAAMRTIEERAAPDIRVQELGLTAPELSAAIQRGQPVTAVEAAGPALRETLRTESNLHPAVEAIVKPFLRTRYEGQAGRYENQLRNMTPLSLDAAETIRDLRSAAEKVNDPAYKAAYAAGSSGIWNPAIENLASTPAIRSAIEPALRRHANKVGVQGGRPMENPFITDPRTGAISLRDPNITPTLEFWDQIKRTLGDEIGELLRKGRNTEAGELTDVKNLLVKQLDAAVPAYKQARAGAHQFFKADNAYDAGLNFMGMKDTVDLSKMIQTVGNMSTVEHGIFAHGVLTDVLNTIRNQGVNKNIANMFNSPNSKRKFEVALGPRAAAELEGFVRVENMMQRAYETAFANSTTAKQAARMGVSSIKSAAPEIAATVAGYGLGGLPGIVGTLIAKHFVSDASKALTADVAESMARKLMSGAPQDIQDIVDIVSKNPAAMESLKKTEMYIQALATQAGEELYEPRKGRATGGSVNRAMTADRLISLLESAHKNNQNKTESILEQPDEHVVKALKVANEHI